MFKRSFWPCTRLFYDTLCTYSVIVGFYSVFAFLLVYFCRPICIIVNKDWYICTLRIELLTRKPYFCFRLLFSLPLFRKHDGMHGTPTAACDMISTSLSSACRCVMRVRRDAYIPTDRTTKRGRRATVAKSAWTLSALRVSPVGRSDDDFGPVTDERSLGCAPHHLEAADTVDGLLAAGRRADQRLLFHRTWLCVYTTLCLSFSICMSACVCVWFGWV